MKFKNIPHYLRHGYVWRNKIKSTFFTNRAKKALKDYLHFFEGKEWGLVPDYDDLWFLYREVRKRKPKQILELGSGCSTVILVQALMDNGHGFLYSAECSQHWLEKTVKEIPSHLMKYCRIFHAPLVEMEYKGITVYKHDIPDLKPDFIYLDSPYSKGIDRTIDPVLLEKDSDFFLVVDGRHKEVAFLKKHLQKRYKVTNRWVFYNTSFERRTL